MVHPQNEFKLKSKAVFYSAQTQTQAHVHIHNQNMNTLIKIISHINNLIFPSLYLFVFL